MTAQTSTHESVASLRKEGCIKQAWEILVRQCMQPPRPKLTSLLLDHVVGRYADEPGEEESAAFLGLEYVRWMLHQEDGEKQGPLEQAGSMQCDLVEVEIPQLREQFETIAAAMKKIVLSTYPIKPPRESELRRIEHQLSSLVHTGTACWFFREWMKVKTCNRAGQSKLWEAMLFHLGQATAIQTLVHDSPTLRLSDEKIQAPAGVNESDDLNPVFDRFLDYLPEDSDLADSWAAAVTTVRLLCQYLLPKAVKTSFDEPRTTTILLLPKQRGGVWPVSVSLELSRESSHKHPLVVPDPVFEGLCLVSSSWRATQTDLRILARKFQIEGCFVWRLRFLDRKSANQLAAQYRGPEDYLNRPKYPTLTALQRPLRFAGPSAGGAFALLMHLHDKPGKNAKSFTVIAGIDSDGNLQSVSQFAKLAEQTSPAANSDSEDGDNSPLTWIHRCETFLLDKAATRLTVNWIEDTLGAKVHLCANTVALASQVTGKPPASFLPPSGDEETIEIDLFGEPIRDRIGNLEDEELPIVPSTDHTIPTSPTPGRNTVPVFNLSLGIFLLFTAILAVYLSPQQPTSNPSQIAESSPNAPEEETADDRDNDGNISVIPQSVKPIDVPVPLILTDVSSLLNHQSFAVQEVSRQLLDLRSKFRLQPSEVETLDASIGELNERTRFRIYLAEVSGAGSEDSDSTSQIDSLLRLKMAPELHWVWFLAASGSAFDRPVGSTLNQEAISLPRAEAPIQVLLLVFTGGVDESVSPPELFLRRSVSIASPNAHLTLDCFHELSTIFVCHLVPSFSHSSWRSAACRIRN